MLSFSEYLCESVNVKSTLEFIKKAHSNQKYGSKPYWTHPKQVADVGRKVFGSKFSTNAQIVALLHDVIEDTPYTRTDLERMGYTKDVLDAVDLVTKDKSLSYMDNIKRIINSGNKDAMMVKYADNYVNFTGDKSSWPQEKREKSQSKYKKSLQTIGSKLNIKDDLPEGFEWMAERYMKSLNMLGEALGVKHDWILKDSALFS